MNIMPIRSLTAALLVAPPTGQHRVCHRLKHSDRARGTSRVTCTHAEPVISYCPSRSLNPNIRMRVRLPRPKSP